ncbi:MAG: glycosyltransferase family 39 protein [Candidatus Omnitrophica bacterium]|nr:glycosyltransferase family 39 protein [Candidatus Omnitrophota bacterium]
MSSVREKFITTGILLFLVLSALASHLYVFDSSGVWTIDEGVYYGLGVQLSHNPTNYNTIRQAEMLEKDRPELAPLPSYFKEPLFKHPPLFCYLIAACMKIFGKEPVFSCIPSALFGALTILLVYFLGKIFFDRRIGLFAALCMWLDPVLNMTSQKMWMDSTLGFFITLAILLYAYGIQKENSRFFFWGGVSVGLAMLTKYTGVLSLGIILLYGIIYHRELFKNRPFIASLCIPFFLLLPWFLWNYKIYGSHFLTKHLFTHELSLGARIVKVMIASTILLAIYFITWKFIRRKNAVLIPEISSPHDTLQEKPLWRRHMLTIVAILFFSTLLENIFRSFSPFYIPITSWAWNIVDTLHPFFYIGRLIEFSPIYFFAFLSFFIYKEERSHKASLLYLSSIVILLFHMAWGGYQSRYIVASLPFLIILGVKFLDEIFMIFSQSESTFVRKIGKALIFFLSIFILLKMNHINQLLSYTNDMCYF